MSLSFSSYDIIRLGKRKLQLTYLKAVQKERLMDNDLRHRKKTCKKLSITDLPDDCLSHIYQNLVSSTDRSYFGLVSRRWLHIRFQHIKFLSLKSQSLDTCLKHHRSRYSDMTLSLFFSWFPCLTEVRLVGTEITDEGLKVLAKCCASLEKVDLTNSQGVTDSGLCSLIQNCSKLRSITITNCTGVTGTGFLGCPKTLTHVDAVGASKLTTNGIRAITSGGGIESLHLSGNVVNNDAVKNITEDCISLKMLQVKSCHELTLEGWTTISQCCRYLKSLYVNDCLMLCDQSLQALRDGCNKLSYLSFDSWSEIAFKLFKQQRPDVYLRNNKDSRRTRIMQ